MIRSLLAVMGSGLLGIAVGFTPQPETDDSVKYEFGMTVTNFEWSNPTPATIAVSGRFTFGDQPHTCPATYSRSVEVIGADGAVLDRKNLGDIFVESGVSRVHYPFQAVMAAFPGEHAVRAVLRDGKRDAAMAQRRCTKD